MNTISYNIGEFVKYREPITPYLDVPERFDAGEVKSQLAMKYDAMLYNLVARAYFADSNFPRAVEYFRKSLAVDPTDRTSIHYGKKMGFVH